MVPFLPNENVERVLSVIPVPAGLDTVRVKDRATRSGVVREGFDERRKAGFGVFYDSAALAPRAGVNVADFLSAEKGMIMVRPPQCTNRTFKPDAKAEMYRADNQHMVNCSMSATARVAVSHGLCSMKVMLNGSTLASGGDIDVKDMNSDQRHNWPSRFDMTSVNVGSVAKLEVYRRSEEIPLELKSNDPECGLILLWTRDF